MLCCTVLYCTVTVLLLYCTVLYYNKIPASAPQSPKVKCSRIVQRRTLLRQFDYDQASRKYIWIPLLNRVYLVLWRRLVRSVDQWVLWWPEPSTKRRRKGSADKLFINSKRELEVLNLQPGSHLVVRWRCRRVYTYDVKFVKRILDFMATKFGWQWSHIESRLCVE